MCVNGWKTYKEGHHSSKGVPFIVIQRMWNTHGAVLITLLVSLQNKVRSRGLTLIN